MQVPLEWSHRGLPEVRARQVETMVRKHVEKLESHGTNLIACRVAVEHPQAGVRGGSPFRVRIELTAAPDIELVVRREQGDGDRNESAEHAVVEAFRVMTRLLTRALEERRREVKRPNQEASVAFVVRLFPDEGYGFIKASDTDEEVYFHRNAVTNGQFDRLAIGTQVRYTATMGRDGPQASTVHIVDKPGSVTQARRGEVNPSMPTGWER
jgi:cold shock CspA family protein